jgi:hypothetical protein
MIITVDVHDLVHTCPASNLPHTVDTRRTVVSIVDGGPCRTPVTVRVGNRSAYISCRRHEPAHRQCVACKTLHIVRDTTITDLGHQAPCQRIEVTG